MEFNQVAFRRLLFFGFLVLALSGLSGVAFAQSNEMQDFTKWTQALPVSSELIQQMQNYGIPNAASLAHQIHGSIIASDLQIVTEFENGKCEPVTKVDILGSESGALEGFVRVETIGCFPKGRAESLLKLYFDPDFRKTAIPQLDQVQLNNDILCEQSEKVPFVLDPTRTCVRIQKQQFGNIHSAIVSLISNGQGFSPYFHREAMVTAVDTARGPRLHVLAFARQKQKVSGMFKGMAVNKIISGQKNIIQLLGQSLQ